MELDVISASKLKPLHEKSVNVIKEISKYKGTFILNIKPISISFLFEDPPDGSVQRGSYCKIDFLPGATSKMLRLYLISPWEREDLDAQVDKRLEKHSIHLSTVGPVIIELR